MRFPYPTFPSIYWHSFLHVPAAAVCAVGAPRACDTGGGYYGTAVRAHGRMVSPGALRGGTCSRYKSCSLMVVKRAWADIDG